MPHSFASFRPPWLTAIFVLCWLVGAPSVAIAQPTQTLTIDSFATDQATLSLTAPGDTGTSTSSLVSGAGILGGERGIQITLDAATVGGNGVAARVSSGAYSYSQEPTVTAQGFLQWDGSDGSIALDPTGLGGVDLTAAGTQDALLLSILFDDTPIDHVLTIYTDGANASEFTISLAGGIFTPIQMVIPYDAFTPSLGAGADFTDVGAVTLDMSSATAPDFVLDFVSTTALVDATKVDTLIVDDDGDGLVDPGDTVRYTVVVSNPDDAGNATANDVVFVSDVDPSTTLVAGSVTTTQGTVATGNTAGDGSVAVDLGNLVDGATATVTFDVVVDDPFPAGAVDGNDEIACQGFVSTDDLTDVPTDDPDTGPEDDPTITPVDADPLVEVTKLDTLIVDDDGDGLVDPGETVRYTLVVSNAGNQDAADASLSSAVDANTALVVGSVTTTQGTVLTGNGAGDDNVLVVFDPLAVGSPVTITFDVTVDSPFPVGVQEIACQATASGPDFPSEPSDDPDTPADDDPTVTPVDADPLVEVTKSDTLIVDDDGDGFVDAGETVRYTVVVSNLGDQAATGAAFTSPVDPNTALVVGSVTTSQGTVTIGNGAGDASVAVAIGTLAAGGAVTITFDVTVDDPFPDGVEEIACRGTASADGVVDEPSDDPDTPADDDPTVTVVDSGQPMLRAQKTAAVDPAGDGDGDGAVDAGDTVVYTVTISNVGSALATGVSFDDTPDAATALVVGSVTTSQGTVLSGNGAGDTTISVDVGTLAATETVTITYRVTVDDPLPDGATLTNQGVVSDDDPDTPDEPTDDPETPEPDDPTVIVPDDPAEVPSDVLEIPVGGPLGLALLLLALSLSGLALLRGRPF